MEKSIGFIGLGVMGAPMARNLSEKHQVVGFDTAEARYVKATGVVKAKGIRDVAELARYVFLSLPSSAIVREVTIGTGGLDSALKEGSVVIDTSTTEPGVSQEISRVLGERGILFLVEAVVPEHVSVEIHLVDGAWRVPVRPQRHAEDRAARLDAIGIVDGHLERGEGPGCAPVPLLFILAGQTGRKGQKRD